MPKAVAIRDESPNFGSKPVYDTAAAPLSPGPNCSPMSIFSDSERATLAWARSVTHIVKTCIPDSPCKAAHDVCDEKQLVDLTIAISLMNSYNRMVIRFSKHATGRPRKLSQRYTYFEYHKM
jgi:alkylhydroperoxidase family enzyme